MPNENNDKGRLVLGHLEAGSSDEHLAYGKSHLRRYISAA